MNNIQFAERVGTAPTSLPAAAGRCAALQCQQSQNQQTLAASPATLSSARASAQLRCDLDVVMDRPAILITADMASNNCATAAISAAGAAAGAAWCDAQPHLQADVVTGVQRPVRLCGPVSTQLRVQDLQETDRQTGRGATRVTSSILRETQTDSYRMGHTGRAGLIEMHLLKCCKVQQRCDRYHHCPSLTPAAMWQSRAVQHTARAACYALPLLPSPVVVSVHSAM